MHAWVGTTFKLRVCIHHYVWLYLHTHIYIYVCYIYIYVCTDTFGNPPSLLTNLPYNMIEGGKRKQIVDNTVEVSITIHGKDTEYRKTNTAKNTEDTTILNLMRRLKEIRDPTNTINWWMLCPEHRPNICVVFRCFCFCLCVSSFVFFGSLVTPPACLRHAGISGS